MALIILKGTSYYNSRLAFNKVNKIKLNRLLVLKTTENRVNEGINAHP